MLFECYSNHNIVYLYQNEKIMKEAHNNDDILLRQLQEGNQVAFTAIYQKYHKALYVFSYYYLKNKEQAEDTIQTVFSKLWEYRFQIIVTVNLKNYLYKMVKNHVLNEIRDATNALTKNYEMAQSPEYFEDNLVEQIEEKELRSLFYKAINKLPDQKRNICLLKIKEGMSNKEIAKKLNIAENSVKVYYNQSIKTLRSYLQKMLIIIILSMLLASLSVL